MTAVSSRSVWLSTLAGVALLFLTSVVPASGLKCIQCGLYNDGVGSITPCLNYTIEANLKECPSEIKECIKYVNGGTTVRECSPGKCVEKRSESWTTSTYCCSEEGCNTAGIFATTTGLAIASTAIAITRLLTQQKMF